MISEKTEKLPLFSIVIVAYNAGEYIRDCLDSVGRQACGDFEVIVVDNGSTDNTADIIRPYKDIKLIVNKTNKGFCAANNQGIRLCDGKYVLTLNADVILHRDFLSELKKAVGEKDAGMLAPKILNKDGNAIDSTGLELSRFYRLFDRGSGEDDSGRYDGNYDIFGPCAAAALYKREMLEDVACMGEYFDEDFFFLVEDFDIAWRARKKGWRALYVPGAVCYHARNSSDFNRDYRQYLSFRNRVFLLIKNADPGIGYLLTFMTYDMPRFFYMLFTNKYTFRAAREIVTYFPMIRKKRKFAQDEKKD